MLGGPRLVEPVMLGGPGRVGCPARALGLWPGPRSSCSSARCWLAPGSLPHTRSFCGATAFTPPETGRRRSSVSDLRGRQVGGAHGGTRPERALPSRGALGATSSSKPVSPGATDLLAPLAALTARPLPRNLPAKATAGEAEAWVAAHSATSQHRGRARPPPYYRPTSPPAVPISACGCPR